MHLIRWLLKHPAVWHLSQNVFSSDAAKGRLYRAAIGPADSAVRLLDVGCANGNASCAFQDLDYYGIDINETFILDARARRSHVPPSHFIAADILDHPFSPSSFDHILFACTGHHLDDSRLLLIFKSLSHLLRPRGAIHFFDPVRVPSADGLLLRLIMRMDQGKFHRTRGEWERLFTLLPNHLAATRLHSLSLRLGLLPHPTMLYTRLVRPPSD